MRTFEEFLNEKDTSNGIIGIEFYKTKDGRYRADLTAHGNTKTFSLSQLFTTKNDRFNSTITELIYKTLVKKGIITKPKMWNGIKEDAIIDAIDKHFSEYKDPFDIVIKKQAVEINKEK